MQLVLHGVEPGAPEAPLANAGLNLEVDDLEPVLQAVRALGGTVAEVKEATPHLPVQVALLRDPAGNAFELRQRVAGQAGT